MATTAFLPFLSCSVSNTEANVQWFLSEEELLKIGKAYHLKSLRILDKNTLAVSGWIITTAEAKTCEKIYLGRA